MPGSETVRLMRLLALNLVQRCEVALTLSRLTVRRDVGIFVHPDVNAPAPARRGE